MKRMTEKKNYNEREKIANMWKWEKSVVDKWRKRRIKWEKRSDVHKEEYWLTNDFAKTEKTSFSRPHQRPLVFQHTSFIYNQAISRNPDEPNVCVVRRVYSANACLSGLCSPWWGKDMAYFVKKPRASWGEIWGKAYTRPSFANNEIVKLGTIIFRSKKYWAVCRPWNHLFTTFFCIWLNDIQKPNMFNKQYKYNLS